MFFIIFSGETNETLYQLAYFYLAVLHRYFCIRSKFLSCPSTFLNTALRHKGMSNVKNTDEITIPGCTLECQPSNCPEPQTFKIELPDKWAHHCSENPNEWNSTPINMLQHGPNINCRYNKDNAVPARLQTRPLEALPNTAGTQWCLIDLVCDLSTFIMLQSRGLHTLIHRHRVFNIFVRELILVSREGNLHIKCLYMLKGMLAN